MKLLIHTTSLMLEITSSLNNSEILALINLRPKIKRIMNLPSVECSDFYSSSAKMATMR